MGAEEFYTEAEMAEMLRIRRATLIKNRCLGRAHPPFKKIGRQILYPKLEYAKWVQGIELKRAIGE